jgi:hypothetical protein
VEPPVLEVIARIDDDLKCAFGQGAIESVDQARASDTSCERDDGTM